VNVGRGYLEHDELRVGGPRVKYCSREDKSHE
jgi:hypothetical protein